MSGGLQSGKRQRWHVSRVPFQSTDKRSCALLRAQERARARVSVLFCQRAGLLGVGVGPPTAGISVKAVAAAVAVTGKRPTMIIFPSRHCVTLTFQLSLSISRSLLLLSVHFIVRFGWGNLYLFHFFLGVKISLRGNSTISWPPFLDALSLAILLNVYFGNLKSDFLLRRNCFLTSFARSKSFTSFF